MAKILTFVGLKLYNLTLFLNNFRKFSHLSLVKTQAL